MALVAGALAIWGQTWAQAHLPATRAAIVMTLEPVFAAGFAVAFGGEVPTPRMLVGGALVLGAMYVVELPGPSPGRDSGGGPTRGAPPRRGLKAGAGGPIPQVDDPPADWRADDLTRRRHGKWVHRRDGHHGCSGDHAHGGGGPQGPQPPARLRARRWYQRRASAWAFYIPHADDDVLSMGTLIQDQVRAGHDVEVVYYTGDGGGSGVCAARDGVCRAADEVTRQAGDGLHRRP